MINTRFESLFLSRYINPTTKTNPIFFQESYSNGVMDSATKKIEVNKNAHLKGRRRFMADFRDLEEECKEGFASCRLRVRSAFVSHRLISGCS